MANSSTTLGYSSEFAIEFAVSESGSSVMRQLGIERDAAISFTFRGMERRVRFARLAQTSRHVAFETLDFLNAHDIPRLRAHQPARKAFAFGRAKAVDVQRDDSHRALQIAIGAECTGATMRVRYTGKNIEIMVRR